MGKLMHMSSGKQDLRTERLISHECQMYRKLIMLEFS